MLRKILAVLLVLTMLVGIVPTTAFAQTEETIVADTTIIETSEKVVAKQEVEDCTVQFEYLKDSEESFLSIGEDRYKLDVLQTDDSVLVSISEDYENVYETKVVAQAATASIAVGLFTVTIVYAAKDIIIAGLTAAVDLGNRAIEVAADSIVKTINNVRAKRLTSRNVVTQTTSERKAAIAAITKIQKAKKNNTNYYFVARLVNGTVYISKQISYDQAVSRLRSGYDVFASSSTAAQKAAKAASPRKRGAPHGSHYSGDGYYPHFHPQGVKWKSNKSHEPHCWYPT